MDFAEYVRKPFVVNAVLITEENIAEIAEHVGLLRKKDDGTSYIQVDRRLIPNVFRVYPGFWMTKMGDNYRCYSGRVFEEQFVQNGPGVDDGVRLITAHSTATAPSSNTTV